MSVPRPTSVCTSDCFWWYFELLMFVPLGSAVSIWYIWVLAASIWYLWVLAVSIGYLWVLAVSSGTSGFWLLLSVPLGSDCICVCRGVLAASVRAAGFQLHLFLPLGSAASDRTSHCLCWFCSLFCLYLGLLAEWLLFLLVSRSPGCCFSWCLGLLAAVSPDASVSWLLFLLVSRSPGCCFCTDVAATGGLLLNCPFPSARWLEIQNFICYIAVVVISPSAGLRVSTLAASGWIQAAEWSWLQHHKCRRHSRVFSGCV